MYAIHLLWIKYPLSVSITKLLNFYSMLCSFFALVLTRKCPLRGHCLAPLGRRQRITLKREKNFGSGGITDYLRILDSGDGQTDVEFEIVF